MRNRPPGSNRRVARLLILLGALALLGARMVATGRPAAALPNFTVNSAGDEPDAVPNGVCATSLGTCTLRAALREAQGDGNPNTINFAIPGAGPHTITLGSSLPEVSDPGGPTVIDGYTQSGATVNTDANVSNAALKIQIQGTGPAGPEAFALLSDGNTVRGLALFNLRIGVRITGASDNLVIGNFIGTNAAGTFGLTGSNSGAPGVFIDGVSTDNQIGRAGPADRNVISGNAGNGVGIGSPGGFPIEANNANKIQNNIIGLSPDGARKLANLNHGVDVNSGASFNLVGGPGVGEGNVSSGNFGTGVEVSHGGGGVTNGNEVVGNKIGTDATGTAGPAYARNGVGNVVSGQNVRLEDQVVNTLVAGNVIGNNENGGIKVDGGVTGTRIEGNRIGRTVTGVAISNGDYGVQLEPARISAGTGDVVGSSNNTVGPGNVIAHNESGIRVQGADTIENTITSNAIFSNDGLGIDLEPLGSVNQNDPGDADTGANTKLNFPVLNSFTPESVTGTACADCRVEIFLADSTITDPTDPNAYGEGKALVGSGDADGSGNFTIPVSGAAGKVVTSTATDDAGNTSEFSRNRSLPTSYASDNFNRTVIAGWGNATVGGAWTPDSSPESFGVNGQRGTMSVAPTQAREMDLQSVSATRLEAVVTVATDRLPAGGDHLVAIVGRRRDSTTMYRARLRIAPDGSVHAGVEANGTLLNEVPVSGLTHSPGTPLRLKAQFVGTNPTTIRVKVWLSGSSEPGSFALSVTDSTAELQQSGSIGLAASSTETLGLPVVVSFDDLSVVSPK